MKITSKQKAILIYKAILNKKASDIVILDLKSYSTFTDFLIICNGHSITQIRTLNDVIQEELKKIKEKFIVNGQADSKWLIIDSFDIVIHIFYPDIRKFYGLEYLWENAKKIEVKSEKEKVNN